MALNEITRKKGLETTIKRYGGLMTHARKALYEKYGGNPSSTRAVQEKISQEYFERTGKVRKLPLSVETQEYRDLITQKRMLYMKKQDDIRNAEYQSDTYKSYAYLIKFKPLNQYYYGIRARNIKLKLHPHEDLMIKYFTSSHKIQQLIREYGLGAFEWEIRKLFDSPTDAANWEQKVLRRCNVIQRQDIWLNGNAGKFIIPSKEGKIRISETHKGKPKSPEHKEKIRKALVGKNVGRIQTEEHRRKNSEANRGKNHWGFGLTRPPEVCKKISEARKGSPAPNKGKRSSQESKDAAANTRRKNTKTCEYCNTEVWVSTYTRWHGERCKHK